MDHREIPLTQGQVALVSACDYPALSAHKWHAVRCGSQGRFYAKRDRMFMHRALLSSELAPGLVVDHINGNSLDNRRENLRAVTPSENSRNLSAFKGASGYRGVFAQSGSFMARVSNEYLGCFETDIEAAFAVNQKLRDLDGEVGVRNAVDHQRLLAILLARRDLLDKQVAAVLGAMA